LAEFDSVIPAGGSGKLVARLKTTPLVDRRVSKTVAVSTDSANVPRLTLRVSVDARTPIKVLPHSRLAVTAIEGEEGRRRALLRRPDGEKLEILEMDTGISSVGVVTTPVVEREKWGDLEAEPGDVWLDLILEAGAPTGSRSGRLKLATNHPDAPSLEVTYAFRVRPLIESRPAGAQLWPSPAVSGEGHSKILTLSLNRKGKFAVSNVEVTHPELFMAYAISEEPGPRQLLRVELNEGLRPESISATVEGWIEVTTDIPGYSVLDVPVLVASSRAGTRRGFPPARPKQRVESMR
jgi:hypothetical protein